MFNTPRITWSITAIVSLYLLSFGSTIAMSREDAIAARLAPIGALNVIGNTEASNGKTLGKDAGIKIYKSYCFACHDTGASGAPKMNDKIAWQTRLKGGMDALYQHAIEGYKAMPAKGGCMSCSDPEIKLAVDYIVEKNK